MGRKRNNREEFDIYSDDDFDILSDDDMEEYENDDDFRDAEDFEDDLRYEDYDEDNEMGFEEDYEDDYRADRGGRRDGLQRSYRNDRRGDSVRDYDEDDRYDDYSRDYEDDEHDDFVDLDEDSRRVSKRSKKRYRDDDYDDNYEDDDEYEGKTKIPRWAHFVVIGIIALVILFFVLKLAKWNSSSFELEESDEKNLEYELADIPNYLSDEQLAMPAHQDGKETILFLGNDAITYDKGETGVVEQIAKETGATCINAGFPGSTIARKAASYSSDFPMDGFCFASVVQAITSGDYAVLHDAAGHMSDSAYESSISTLEKVDFNNIDTIVVDYNAQDYLDGRIGMNPDDPKDEVTYKGALSSGIAQIQETYPHIRIVCMTLTYCFAYNSEGKTMKGRDYDGGNGVVVDYYQYMIDACSAAPHSGVSVIDNYYGTITDENSQDMLLDNVHVNADCNKYIAKHFAEFYAKVLSIEKGEG